MQEVYDAHHNTSPPWIIIYADTILNPIWYEDGSKIWFFNSQPKGKGIRYEARTIPNTITREEKVMTHEIYERKEEQQKAYEKVMQHSSVS